MKKRGRILVVDDRPDWRTVAAESLNKAGFEAEAVETVDQARAALEQALYHVLILDICFDSTSNEEGLHFLRELDQRELTRAIQIVMFSNYGTKEIMRETFRDYDIADFIEKTPFEEKKFVKDIQNVFAKDTHLNLNMTIRWSQTSGPEAVAADLKLQQGYDETDPSISTDPLPTQLLAAELEDLLRRLFYEADNVLARPMSPGYSGSGVLLVRPFFMDGGGSPVIVKYGSASQIQQEYTRYKQFVERFIGGGHCTSIHDLRRTIHLGGINYTFLGASGPTTDFTSYYKQHEATQIKQALDHLFLTTCGEWYANADRLGLVDLFEDYQRTLGFTLEKLRDRLKQLSGVHRIDQKYLSVESLQSQKRFIDPLLAIERQDLAYPTCTCPTHGDFNQHNLQVDNDGHIWMIDFQNTGHGHILRDFVALDDALRLQMLTTSDATLEERLDMDQALCSIDHFSEVDQLDGGFQTDNPHLAKTYDIVVHLRKLARQVIRHNSSDDFHEYYAALLLNSLNTLRFTSLEQEQRIHALLSASLLAEKLQAGVR
ncbi:MAG TPA: response regulator [Ktedonobacteraceae bacterium]|jgi:CheY-like chemotaxis protein|nr:response regulator [Ktedonobacteraceae bacterium]